MKKEIQLTAVLLALVLLICGCSAAPETSSAPVGSTTGTSSTVSDQGTGTAEDIYSRPE